MIHVINLFFYLFRDYFLTSSVAIICFFFFFQAEDGIRDTSVTGVQTCALPILVDLPAGTINHHWTKNVIASADGSTLYVSVGSNSNAAENGVDKEQARAAIWERSEERRVGKECRGRGAREQCKIKAEKKEMSEE